MNQYIIIQINIFTLNSSCTVLKRGLHCEMGFLSDIIQIDTFTLNIFLSDKEIFFTISPLSDINLINNNY